LFVDPGVRLVDEVDVEFAELDVVESDVVVEGVEGVEEVEVVDEVDDVEVVAGPGE